MRQPIDQTHACTAQLGNPCQRWSQHMAIAALVLSGCFGLPAWSVAAPVTVRDLQSPSKQAETLTGTVAQPYVETLLPVPQPPTGSERTDPMRSGGTADPVVAEPMMEIERQLDFAIEPITPVLDPVGRALPEQTNLLRVTLP